MSTPTAISHLPKATHSFAKWPAFDQEQIDAASAVLASGKVNYWTGEVVKEFEREYAAHLGVKHAVAVYNGTIALELILRGLAIGPGDDVVVACRTYVATASSVLWVGARPVFADVDPVSGNVTADTIQAALTPATKAVILVHLGGWPCEMTPIMRLAQKRGFKVVEDCAQSNHAQYRGRMAGALGHVAAFSFCQDKIITTGGEGGLIATDDDALWDRLWSLKDHGKSYDAVYKRQHPVGFRWLHEHLGTNGRMTEMQAAIGRVALRRLPEWVARRTENAAAYRRALSGLPAVQLLDPPGHLRHSYYRYYFLLRPDRLLPEWSRDRILTELTSAGYPCFSGSCCEIYLEKIFDGLRPAQRLPHARGLTENSLCLLTHPTLSSRDCAEIGAALRNIVTEASL